MKSGSQHRNLNTISLANQASKSSLFISPESCLVDKSLAALLETFCLYCSFTAINDGTIGIGCCSLGSIHSQPLNHPSGQSAGKAGHPVKPAALFHPNLCPSRPCQGKIQSKIAKCMISNPWH
jgi:hypothetical protein